MLEIFFLIIGIFIISFILLFVFCALRIASICDYEELLYTKSLNK